jgi:hypothetical protein
MEIDKLITSWNNLPVIQVGSILYWVPDVTFSYDQKLIQCEPVMVKVMALTSPNTALVVATLTPQVYCINAARPEDNPTPCGVDRLYPTSEAAWERIVNKLKPIVEDANKALHNAKEKAKWWY